MRRQEEFLLNFLLNNGIYKRKCQNGVIKKVPISKKDVQSMLYDNGNEIKKAFTHKDYDSVNNYEDYELIGDRIIKGDFVPYIETNYDIKRKNHKQVIATIEKWYFSTLVFSKIAIELGLKPMIIHSHDTKIDNSILEDIFESFIGLLYEMFVTYNVEDPRQQIQNIVYRIFDKTKFNVDNFKIYESYRTQVKELGDKKGFKVNYKSIDSMGFVKVISVYISGIFYALGKGDTVEVAKENAAQKAYNKLIKEY
jgi:dsRNA-specific ribonuclease